MSEGAAEVVRILYVAGSGRSGSTLLARLLGQVPGIVSVGEVRNLVRLGYLALPNNVQCGCGAVFARCPFWTGVRDRLSQLAPDIDVARVPELVSRVERIRYLPALFSPLKTPRFKALLAETQRFFLTLYRAILAQGGAKVVLDESKDLALLFLLTQMPQIDLSILHLVRDSRAVANSWMRLRRRPEFTEGERFMRQASPLTTAMGWWYRNLGAELAGRMGRYRCLRYEDLVAQPEARLAAVLEDAGLAPKLSHLSGTTCRILEPDHLATGNPMRLESGAVEIRPDMSWRSEMKPGAKSLVTVLTSPLLLRYGYRLSVD